MMNLKFSFVTFLALASVKTRAFFAPTTTTTRLSSRSSLDMVGSWDNEDFLAALSGGNGKSEGEEEPRDGDQGGSRLKEIMAIAKRAKSSTPERGFRPVENPFLTRPTQSFSPTNPEEMSVEEQARRFREMMQGGGGAASAPPPSRYAKTDRAGRPVGRNRDADSIANAADLYFAQLKRDSSVRGAARMRGDDEKAEKVFADAGIKELENLMYENPYLKGQRDKEKIFFDTVPEELVRPYFDPDSLPDDEKATSGISYRELLKQRGQKKAVGVPQVQNQTPPPPQAPQIQQPPQIQQTPQIQQQLEMNQPARVQESPQTQQPPAYVPPPQTALQLSTTTNTDEMKGKIRTLMGMLLKHRGGPGFGKGRLQGREIDQFNNLLQEILGRLREEAAGRSAATAPPLIPVSATPQQAFFSPQPFSPPPAIAVSSPSTPGIPSQLDSMIACVDGAIKMYKNCPPELQGSVLTTLRAALASAVRTCDGVIGYPDQNPAPVMSQVEGTIAVIEGAVMIYKNSPPELQPSVLLTLRSAFRAAVSTCDSITGGGPPQPSWSAVPAAPFVPLQPPAQTTAPWTPDQLSPEAVAASPAPVFPPTDPNSKILEDVYNKMKAAAGDGSLGLRSDLTSEDASALADKLVEMRAVLMEELDTGIPAPEPEAHATTQAATESVADGISTVSKYQQMLAKAKAEKAAGTS